MIAIIDYGMGNLFSVKNALEYLGEKPLITRDAAELEKADAMILPGVGAFPDAMRELDESGLTGEVKRQAAKKPLLGICLGMQMLFETGNEFEKCSGLGLIPGYVDKIPAKGLKIPHMGWNSLEFSGTCPLVEGVPQGAYVYFVHSYMAFAEPQYVCAAVDYGCKVTALVSNGSVFGAQFHPEKSGETGLMILRNFARLGR